MNGQIDMTRIPRHVAIIMDGNGRWAKAHGHERSFGHENGVVTVRQITEMASELGVEYLTLYTFSTENWHRPQAEVDLLMNLVVTSIEQRDLDRLPVFARERLERCFDDTAHCTGLVLCLALSYSSRWELVEACRSITRAAQQGTLDPDSIDDTVLSQHLSTASMPDPDLLIRTGGDLRISNFLLWQIAYSELYFTDKYWPEFSKQDFIDAIVDYQQRERRYGKTSEQIQTTEN